MINKFLPSWLIFRVLIPACPAQQPPPNQQARRLNRMILMVCKIKHVVEFSLERSSDLYSEETN
jgi:hypothetical protein